MASFQTHHLANETEELKNDARKDNNLMHKLNFMMKWVYENIQPKKLCEPFYLIKFKNEYKADCSKLAG